MIFKTDRSLFSMTVFLFFCVKKWQPSVYDFVSPWLLRINLIKLTSVDVLALSMAWRCQCFGTVNVLARSIFYNGLCFGAVAQMPASDNPWGTSYIKSNFYTDCTKILTMPKHQPNRYTNNDGPKGHLVLVFTML